MPSEMRKKPTSNSAGAASRMTLVTTGVPDSCDAVRVGASRVSLATLGLEHDLGGLAKLLVDELERLVLDVGECLGCGDVVRSRPRQRHGDRRLDSSWTRGHHV